MTGQPGHRSRLYAIALRAFPAAHRELYGAEMTDNFARRYDERLRSRGRFSALAFSFAAAADVVGAGFGERRRRRANSGRQRGHDQVSGWARDLKYATRALSKTRTFSIVCVVSLGLGLGVVFSISMFLRTLTATPEAIRTDGLVELVVNPLGPLRARVGDWALETWSYPDFEDLRDADTGLAVAGWRVDDSILRSDELAPQRTSAMWVSENYFNLLGVTPAHGRLFRGDDAEAAEAAPRLIVSHSLWMNRLGGDPEVIGSTLRFNRVPHTVVGIAQEGFRGHFNRRGAPPADLWIPLAQHPAVADPAGAKFRREADWLRVVGRLEDDTSLAESNGAVSALMVGLAEQYPGSNEFKTATVVPYTSSGANQILEMSIVTVMFYGLSGMVLLVVCLNVAGMVLVRSASREPELAMRQALGASRGRLVRHLMSESIVLALAGGTLSVAVVYGGAAALGWWFEGPAPSALALTPGRIAACVALSLATTVIFGILPALRFSRATMVRAIKEESGGGSSRVGRVHRLAAALQVGIALPFLVLGGLLFDSARETATADLGFTPEGLFASSLAVSAAGYAGDDADTFLASVQERLEQASGVASVTVADGLPLDYNLRRSRISVAGDEARVVAHTTRIGAGYFAALETPLIRGRAISDADTAGAERVAILSETLAGQLFPAGDALGRQVASSLQGTEEQLFTVVGVAADVATSQMQTERPQIFVPLAEQSASRVFVIARASADAQSMRVAFEQAVADLDPDFSRPVVITGEAMVRDNIGDLLEQSTLAIIIAAVALGLSALGIYGVVAFMVESRTREMGVRIALGAQRRHVINTVLLDTCKLTVPGLAIGIGLAMFAVRETGLVWHQMGTVEPLAYGAAIAAALVVALGASLPSARRAATVEPLDAIRAE